MKPLPFNIYGLIAEAQRGAPDLSLLEMSRQLGASYGVVRATVVRMERRGIVRRIYRGVYRLPLPPRSGQA